MRTDLENAICEMLLNTLKRQILPKKYQNGLNQNNFVNITFTYEQQSSAMLF